MPPELADTGWPQVVYLSTEGLPPTVLESQVGDHLVHMIAHGLRVHWIALIGLREYRHARAVQRQRRDAIRARIGGAVDLVPFPYPRLTLGLPWLLYRLRQLVGGTGRFVIHARGHDACRLALGVHRRMPGARVIFDVRGEAAAEAEYEADGRSGSGLEHAVAAIRTLESRAAEEADAWFCVSNVLRDRMVSLYPALRGRAPHVVPCAASGRKFHFDAALRTRTRERLGLAPDAPLLVYVGQLIRYEIPEATAAAMIAARDVWPRARILVVTPRPEVAAALLRDHLPADSWTAVAARHDEVNAYLNAGDLAFLLRERHLLNEVACPTKFAEYAMSGLPVVLTEGIGDCSRYVRETGAGIVLRDVDELTTLRRELPGLDVQGTAARAHRAASGRSAFARERHDATYLGVYGRLLGQDLASARPSVQQVASASS